MQNKFPGICYRCGKKVGKSQGFFERYRGGWRVQHGPCAKKYKGTKHLVTNVFVDRSDEQWDPDK